jgi:hypothetical protein
MMMALWSPEDGGAGGAAGSGAAGAAAPVAFAETLPEDIRGEAAFRDIKDLGGLAKSYLHAQRLIGRDPSTVLPIPGTDDADGWNTIYTRLGRPEQADGYQLPAPPEGLTENPELKTAFQQAAHKAGLSQRQAADLAAWWNGAMAQTVQGQNGAQQRTEAAGEATLKQEWGAAYDEKLHLARSAMAHYGDEQVIAYYDKTRLGNDPAVLKMFAKIGSQLAEDGLVGRGEGAGRASPAEAQQQISGLQKDAAFMKSYMDRRDPGHAAAVQRMQGLYDFAYPAART